jgi:hypothetical protein
MADRKTSFGRRTLHPETELPDAPHPSSFPPPKQEPPALIAGKDLEHYWNETKWPALITVIVQALAFIANQPASLEWFLDILLAIYLAIRVRRRGGDSAYLLAVTGIGGAFAGMGLAIAHLVIAHRLFNLFELISRPAITGMVTMVSGVGPVILLDHWRARRAAGRIKPSTEPNPNHGDITKTH